MIAEKQETNKVKSMTALIYCLEKISRSQCTERKTRESLVTSHSLKYAFGSPGKHRLLEFAEQTLREEKFVLRENSKDLN